MTHHSESQVTISGTGISLTTFASLICVMIPGLFSLRRLTTLVGALLVTLGGGTNYAYSAYAPQLGSRLRITNTQLNVIALGGNMGMYICGPIWGRVVDSRGPRILFVLSCLFLFVGYCGMYILYNAGIPESTPTVSTIGFLSLIFFYFLTGAGGNSGFAASVNTTAKTFPDHARATATGIVISGIGLSAFLFTTVAHYALPGDTSAFFKLLAVGTALPMALAYFLVRPVPFPSSARYEDLESTSSVSVLHHDNNSRTHLIGHRSTLSTPSEQYIPDADFSVELEVSPTRSHSRHLSLGAVERRRSSSRKLPENHDNEDDDGIFGTTLFKSTNFWLICTILSLLSGTGQMYIYNVGSMSQALYQNSNKTGDDMEIQKWQALQVSTISLMNFSGRFLIGFTSDFIKHRLHLPRSFGIVIISAILLLSQLLAAVTPNVENLWKTSALVGLGYGCVFSLFPNVTIEWFGMAHFSENWGIVSLSPLLAGNLFSLAFGRVLDAHTTHASPTTLATESQCLEGLGCYVAAIRLTIFATFCALVLSVWAGWRDYRAFNSGERWPGIVACQDEDSDE